MALNATRILFTIAPIRWNRKASSAYRLQSLFTNSQVSQNNEHAFWDSEGSVVVDQAKQTRDLKYHVVGKQKESKNEDSEIVRITSFGHVRLDLDNPPIEHKDHDTAKEPDSLNFIDNQFFGSQLSTKETPQLTKENPKFQASNVPLDTNPVDQQYFYPYSAETEKTVKVLHAPSASELEFEENEVDDQYFGKKSATSAPQAPLGKVSAYTYLKSLQGINALSLNSKTNDSANNDDKSTKKIYEEMVPNLYKMPNDDIVFLLKKSIIYNKDGIVALDKPYGLVSTDADGNATIVLTKLLPALSRVLRVEKLYTVHRLDRDTTGVLLLASNQVVANKLNKLFFDQQIKKKYVTITKGIPHIREGTISIPLTEKSMGERQRMTLRPVQVHSKDSVASSKYNAKGKSFHAVTHFKVKKSSVGAAFVELEPETGVRHQLRVHLSEGLNCPILGDHKYSHDDKYAPQKLPQTMLDLLAVKQSKVRNIPMHLHASSIVIPGFGEEGKELYINSPLPKFFRYTMKKLKLFRPRTE
ncbi:pseudouridylate synthase RPUSD4, mitochondrial-like [Daphnia carinata]|uniref:pseudouridylate synthase RPUSD4, mitochondrial-like n=1 Tax=Daphnia carinata TaxID=120202 RepID=UPI002580D73E|nr:pseudouridylate synthase RPUSD4, mitochondrial-like [Daphnia carinata]